MDIENLEVEGRIAIMLNSLSPNTIENYVKEVKEDELNTTETPSNRFLSQNLKSYKKVFRTYPSVYFEEIIEPDFIPKYRTRFNRLSIFMSSMYYFKIMYTNSSIKEIIQYADENRVSRVLVFPTHKLVDDYLKIVKIFKLNSFLSCRELNELHSPNLYSRTGFIRKKKVTKMLKGKGRAVSKFTFRTLELELDKRLDKAPVHYIRTGERFEEEIYGDFFSENPLSLVDSENLGL